MSPKNIEEQMKDLNEDWEALLIGISLAKISDSEKIWLYSGIEGAVEAGTEFIRAQIAAMLEGFVLKYCDICGGMTLHSQQGSDTDDQGRTFELAICTVCSTVNYFDPKKVWVYCASCDVLFETEYEVPDQAPGGIYYEIETHCNCPAGSRATIYESLAEGAKKFGTKDNPYTIRRIKEES